MLMKSTTWGWVKAIPLFLYLSNNYAASTDSWSIDLAPYLWAINLNGHVRVGPAQASISQSFSEIMKHFQGGGMLWLNARKDKFSVFANLLYSVLKDSQTFRALSIGARNNFGIFSAGAAYEVLQHTSATQNSHMSLELFAGARYTLNNTSVALNLKDH